MAEVMAEDLEQRQQTARLKTFVVVAPLSSCEWALPGSAFEGEQLLMSWLPSIQGVFDGCADFDRGP